MHVVLGDTHLIVDTGPDFRQQALRAKIPRVDAVFYTHSHADHIMGMDDLRQFNRRQSETLPIYVPRQYGTNILAAFDYAFREAPARLYRPKLVMHLLDADDVVSFPKIDVQAVPVMHGDEEIAAFLFTADGSRMGYVSECKSIPTPSKERLRDLDLLILGAIWTIDKDHPNHLTLNQALEVIKELSPKKALITHITHLMGLHQTVTEDLPAAVGLAYDGLTITL